jgi:putative peptidoglycan lipid II flippase
VAGETPRVDAAVSRAGAVMAIGTVGSRITGFFRDLVMIWAIGTTVFAETYNVANTIPNIVYILLAGGALNAVFVPQLVRALRNDADGGRAFADRLITAIGLVLLVVTVFTVIFAPLVIRSYAYTFSHSDAKGDYDVAVTFARYFLPQIFFYGLHVMFGQVLNARGKFGPMMFTPILNNLVVIVTGILFLVATHGHSVTPDTVSAGEVRLLGIGTTLGVVVQALALLPALRATDYRYRPRFDLRGKGLGHSYALAKWTLLFVLVNQVAYVVVVQLSTAAGLHAADAGYPGRGFTPYTKAYLIMLLPHAVVTVSVVTALLPKMSRSVADGRLDEVRADLVSGLRLTGAAIVPAAIGFGVLGPSLSIAMFAHGNTTVDNAQYIGFVLSAFALGLVPFTVHYQLLRGFYAFEDTRTPVTINVWIAGSNIALAVGANAVLPDRWVCVALAASYSLSYLVGVQISAHKLSRRLGPLGSEVLRAYDRLIVAGVAAAVPTLIISELCYQHWGNSTTGSMVTVVLGGFALLVSYLVVATRMGIAEVADLISTVRARLGR